MEKDHGLNIPKYLIVPYRSDLAKEIFISLNLWQREHWTINTKPTCMYPRQRYAWNDLLDRNG